jgi:hypothetical protein
LIVAVASASDSVSFGANIPRVIRVTNKPRKPTALGSRKLQWAERVHGGNECVKTIIRPQ